MSPPKHVVSLALGFVLTAPACTLVYGWNDLEGGSRDAGVAPIVDASSVDSGLDAPSATDGRAPTCVAACDAGACCYSLVDHQLTCSASCPAEAALLACVDGRDCKGQTCCSVLVGGKPGSACVSGSCAAGSSQLCDPADPTSCPSGHGCVAGTLAPWVCQ